MSHHDEHVTKIIRSLSLWAGVFGTRQGRVGLLVEGSSTSTESGGQLLEKTVEGKAKPGQEEQTGAADAILGMYPGSPKRAAFFEETNIMPIVGLIGSEFLDGSLFLKAALLTLDRMNWDLKDDPEEKERKKKLLITNSNDDEFWDFKGFFKQGAEPMMKAKC
jgi:hypothetical protein